MTTTTTTTEETTEETTIPDGIVKLLAKMTEESGAITTLDRSSFTSKVNHLATIGGHFLAIQTEANKGRKAADRLTTDGTWEAFSAELREATGMSKTTVVTECVEFHKCETLDEVIDDYLVVGVNLGDDQSPKQQPRELVKAVREVNKHAAGKVKTCKWNRNTGRIAGTPTPEKAKEKRQAEEVSKARNFLANDAEYDVSALTVAEMKAMVATYTAALTVAAADDLEDDATVAI